MTFSRLIRWAGLAAVFSGVLSVVGDLLRLFVDVENSETATTVPYTLVFLMYLLGTALLLLGLVGLYTSQSEVAGVLGFVGFLAAFLGTVLLVGVLWFELFITPDLATRAPELAEAELGLAGFILVFLLGIIGWLLFGVATLRAGVYPKLAVVLVMVGVVISYFPIPLSGIIFSAGIAWLGLLLFKDRYMASEQSARVS